MTLIWQHVSDPALSLRRQFYAEPVEVIGSPIYGRVLFRSHEIDIQECRFVIQPDAAFALKLSGDVHGARICGCWLEGQLHPRDGAAE